MKPSSIISLLVLVVLVSPVFGQSDFFDMNRQSSISQTSFLQENSDEDEESLEEKLQRLELRLRELENDVENKLEDESDVDEDEAESKLMDRVTQLEKQLESQKKQVDKFGGILPNLVYHGHESPRLQLFGRIHYDYWAFPKVDDSLFPLEGGTDPRDRFIFRRLRIGVGGDLSDNMFYKYEGEFSFGANPQYRDAFLGFRNVPYLNTVIIGNHKRPYSLDQLNSSNFNATMERPFIADALNEGNRRLGISSNGFTEDLGWNWRYGIWNHQFVQNQAGYLGDHYQLEVAGRIARTAWYDECSGGRGYAHFAISGAAGAVDGGPGSTNNRVRYRAFPEAQTSNQWIDTGVISGANAIYLVGLESTINVGAFQFVGEFMRNNVDRLDAVGEDVAFDGGYVQAAYFLTGEHQPWNRERGVLGRVKPFENFFLVRDCDCNVQSGWGAFQVVTRYSWADFNDFDINGGEINGWTFGFNWHWNPYARMQFNYLIGEVENGFGGGFGDYEIFGVRMMVDF